MSNQALWKPVDPQLVPPRNLIFDGKGKRDSAAWVTAGQNFVRHFLVQRALLKPSDWVLDVGCGIGNKAAVLTSYLNDSGAYYGFDVVKAGIDWCSDRYADYANFDFRLVDLHSEHYNKSGQQSADDFVFPYDDAQFDVVLLASVFTHMLPSGVENYTREIARVLKPGGRAVVTFFLLNDESEQGIAAGNASVHVDHEWSSNGCRVLDPKIPEKTVAHREEFVRECYRKTGLSISDISYGFWCGRKDPLKRLQDVIVAVK